MDFTYITVLDFGNGKVYQYNLADVGDNYLFEDKDEPQAEDGIRDLVRSRGLGDVYKRQFIYCCAVITLTVCSDIFDT